MKGYCGLSNMHYPSHPGPNSSDWKVFIIKSGNESAGVTGMYRLGHDDNEYWVAWFGILPKFRGSGIAEVSINNLISIIKLENRSANKLMDLLCLQWVLQVKKL